LSHGKKVVKPRGEKGGHKKTDALCGRIRFQFSEPDFGD
jgi:hypothetical protein